MSLEPLVVGSIKDRVVCSVWALGELATRDRLSKAVDCNGALLSIAVEGLERDGYMRLAEAGHYILADELAATMPPQRSASESNPVERNDAPAAPAPTAPASPEVFDMASKKRCTSCREEKDAEKDFYANHGKCKRCFLKHQRGQKTKRAGKDTSTAAAVANADELVIPAAGEIRCRVIHNEIGPALAFAIQQGNDQVVCSLDQLQVLRDWATSQLKKVSE